MYKHAYSMRPVLGRLLHDLGKVDCEEEAMPREVGQQVHLLHMFLPIREGGCPVHCITGKGTTDDKLATHGAFRILQHTFER